MESSCSNSFNSKTIPREDQQFKLPEVRNYERPNSHSDEGSSVEKQNGVGTRAENAGRISDPQNSRTDSKTDNVRLGSKKEYNRWNSENWSTKKPKCRTMTAENEIKAQYRYLKEQYSRICEQESILRNQMALLHAEIILMQTKAYHKSPADVRRITIHPISIRKMESKVQRKVEIPSVATMRQMAVKVDGKITPGRYFTTKASKQHKMPSITKTSPNGPTEMSKLPCRSPRSKLSQYYTEYETEDIVNKCFYFDIPLAVVSPPYTQIPAEKVTRHRLQKLKLPKIKINQ